MYGLRDELHGEPHAFRILIADEGTEEQQQALGLLSRLSKHSVKTVCVNTPSGGDGNAVCICAVQGTEIVGTLVLVLQRPVAFIEHLVMKNRVHLHSVDQQMVYFAEQTALFNGCTELRMFVDIPYLEDYETFGYSVLFDQQINTLQAVGLCKQL